MRWGKRDDPQQESSIALQRAIAQTLQRRVVAGGGAITTDEEADFLADHIADDLMSIQPLVPPEHWARKNAK